MVNLTQKSKVGIEASHRAHYSHLKSIIIILMCLLKVYQGDGERTNDAIKLAMVGTLGLVVPVSFIVELLILRISLERAESLITKR